MWLNDYELLSSGDKERFRNVTNYLLNKTYLVSDIYEPRDRVGKINGNYRFVERYFEIFKSYLELAGFTLNKDDGRGIIYLTSDYNYNTFRLDKLTTLFMLTLRSIYDEEIEKNSTKNVVFVRVSDCLLRMMEEQLIVKKPAAKDVADTLRVLFKYNICSRLEGQIEDQNCLVTVYPTILKVVSNDKINAIHEIMFKENESEESEGGTN